MKGPPKYPQTLRSKVKSDQSYITLHSRMFPFLKCVPWTLFTLPAVPALRGYLRISDQDKIEEACSQEVCTTVVF
eukprot:5599096-Amphidinium_carterae.1